MMQLQKSALVVPGSFIFLFGKRNFFPFEHLVIMAFVSKESLGFLLSEMNMNFKNGDSL
jgi:hypothetical protein